VVDGTLGLFLLAVFCVCVVVLAACITWAVVKISPTKRAKTESPT
jgi:hypothetical protein